MIAVDLCSALSVREPHTQHWRASICDPARLLDRPETLGTDTVDHTAHVNLIGAPRLQHNEEISMDKLPSGTWVVVTDGTGARLFHSVGKGPKISLQQKERLQPEDLLNDGPAGGRPPEQSEQATDEATFAKQLAHKLNAAALKHEYEHLVLMADPQTLGQLRPLLHGETTKRILKEVAKTFTNSPLEDIEAALA